MLTKAELKEKLVSVAKELRKTILELHERDSELFRKFNNLIEEERILKLKLEKGKYDQEKI